MPEFSSGDCDVQGGVYYVVARRECDSIRSILAILNSRLLSYLYEMLFGGMHMGGGYMRYRSRFLESLPLPKDSSWTDSASQKHIEMLVTNVLEECAQGGTSGVIGRQIDELVYKTYCLTPEEIAIVEGKK
jgi:adenine-specific DNA-methyltransferase